MVTQQPQRFFLYVDFECMAGCVVGDICINTF